MTSPPVQHSDACARQLVEEFIAAPGAPVPVDDGAALTSDRGDDMGVEGNVSRSSV
jgi:hypothetical protein